MMQPLVIVALLASPPTAAPAADKPAQLEAALRAGHTVDLRRLGRELGAAGLAPLLAPAAPRAQRLAALEASVAAPDAPLLLGALARWAGRPDRRSAASAARAAAAIAGNLSLTRALQLDLAPADLARWGEVYMILAAEPGRWTDVRVHALEVAAALSDAMPDTWERRPFDLARALNAPEPQLRRAALELVPVPLPDELASTVVAQLDDSDPSVTLAAAQAICAAVPLADDSPGRDSAATALARLGERLDRVRALLADPSADLLPATVLDVAHCLVADASTASVAALRQAAARLPGPARARLAQLVDGRSRKGEP